VSNLIVADVKRRSEARLADRLVLLELADEAGHDGWVLISAKTIAQHTKLGLSTVRESLNTLADPHGLGEVECRSGKTTGQSSVYRVLLSDDRPQGEPLPERLTRVGRVARIQLPPGGGGSPDSGQGVARLQLPGSQTLETPIEEESAPGTAPGTAPLAPDGAEAANRPAHAVPARRDLLFEAVVEACGWDPTALTAQARGWVNGALPELRRLEATPDEVRWKARVYRANDPAGKRPTPSALVKHWPALTAQSLERVDRRQLDRELAQQRSEQQLLQALEGR
jgi:hypothetical protein